MIITTMIIRITTLDSILTISIIDIIIISSIIIINYYYYNINKYYNI